MVTENNKSNECTALAIVTTKGIVNNARKATLRVLFSLNPFSPFIDSHIRYAAGGNPKAAKITFATM